MRIPLFPIIAVLITTALLGCNHGAPSGPGATPEATVQAMLAAVQAGDALALASLYDYSESAKAQNPDWNDIPKGQQDLILKKEAERNADTLKPSLDKWKTALAGASVGTAQVTGDSATVTVGSATLTLVQRDAKWYLSGGVAQ